VRSGDKWRAQSVEMLDSCARLGLAMVPQTEFPPALLLFFDQSRLLENRLLSEAPKTKWNILQPAIS
jgi:hypothetical protein